MVRRITAAVLAALGVALIIVCNAAIERAAIPPVAIHKLGLPPEAVAPFREFVASLPPLQVVGASSDEDNQRKRVILDSHLLRVGGGQWPWHGPQETGDCAAQAIAGGIELDIAVGTETDSELVWRPVDRAAIYGGGRVTVGKRAIRGEGLVPSWGLQWVDQYGILWADEPGVGPYSGQRCDLWGRDGVPAEFAAKAKPYAGLTYARCDSAQAVCNAIVAGHPVAFGSMRWGTDRIKLVEGRNLAFDTTDWPHAQIVTGYDGTLSSGQRLFRFLNSWGPNAHNPKSQMPGDHPGAYYVTWESMESIAREGMAFALSGANGFRQRQFVPDFSVIGAAGPVPLVQQEETAAMFPLSPDLQLPGTLLGCVLIVAACVLLFVRGNAALRVGGVALLAVIGLPQWTAAQSTTAQSPDFALLTRTAQPSTTTPATGDSPRWDALTDSAQLNVATETATCPCGCRCVGCRCLTPFTQVAEVIAPQPKPKAVIDAYAPTWCSTCPQWQRILGDGDGELLIIWHKTDPPAALNARIVPAFVHNGGLLVKDPAGLKLSDLRRLVGLPAVKPSAAAK